MTPESLFSIIDSAGTLTQSAHYGSILVANSPQTVLSFLFLYYNGLCTSMLLNLEWFSYAHHRKPLRVTKAVGQQRSTYFLQMPYKYGIPFMAMSAALHWLVSQSLFFVLILIYKKDIHVRAATSVRLGYSCIAIIFTIILGCVVVLTCVLLGCRKYRADMPLASICSAAISAACHQPREDGDAAELPLMWGVTATAAMTDEVPGSPGVGQAGHCCFTSFPVSPPQEGHFYAGIQNQSQKMEHLDCGSQQDKNEETQIDIEGD